MSLMAAACVHTITVAVETASERLQEIVYKFLKPEKVAVCLSWRRSKGFEPRRFFIIGFPGETLAEIEQTIRFARTTEFILLRPSDASRTTLRFLGHAGSLLPVAT